jgi:serine/threonine protein kinase
VVAGGVPTCAADSWALGCVTYQCLSGRPPFLEGDDESTRRRIVKFHAEPSGPACSAASNPVDALFEDKHAAGIEPSARAMIRRLLERHPSARPTMPEVAALPFFAEAGVEPFGLYRGPAHPLDVGAVSPGPADAQWSRRQYSSIWAPQPEAYDLSLVPQETVSSLRAGGSRTPRAASEQLPIPEGDEGPSFFSARGDEPAESVNSAAGPAGRGRRPIPTTTKRLLLGRISER